MLVACSRNDSTIPVWLECCSVALTGAAATTKFPAETMRQSPSSTFPQQRQRRCESNERTAFRPESQSKTDGDRETRVAQFESYTSIIQRVKIGITLVSMATLPESIDEKRWIDLSTTTQIPPRKKVAKYVFIRHMYINSLPDKYILCHLFLSMFSRGLNTKQKLPTRGTGRSLLIALDVLSPIRYTWIQWIFIKYRYRHTSLYLMLSLPETVRLRRKCLQLVVTFPDVLISKSPYRYPCRSDSFRLFCIWPS